MKDEGGLSCLLYMSLYNHRLDSRKRHSDIPIMDTSIMASSIHSERTQNRLIYFG